MQKQSLQQRIIQPNALIVLMFRNPGLKPWTFKDYVVLLSIFHPYAMPFGDELSAQKHSSCLGVFKAADFAELLFKECAMFTQLLTGIKCALETKQEMYKRSRKIICWKHKEEHVSSFSSPDMAFMD